MRTYIIYHVFIFIGFGIPQDRLKIRIYILFQIATDIVSTRAVCWVVASSVNMKDVQCKLRMDLCLGNDKMS